jgi:hypothetical protein
MAQWSGVWQRAWRIIVALVLTSATLLSLGAPEVSACYTWQVGARVGLREGAQIRTGPGLAYAVHTTLQPGVSDWPVDIIDGPRYADGREWWDTSRVHVDGGGTGWVDKAQAAWDLCSSNPQPDPGNVYVQSGLELQPDPNHSWPPLEGDNLIGRFTIGNNGGQSIRIDRHGVRLFRNGSENLSFLNNGGSVDLSPGQTVRFDQNNEYHLPTGHYRAEITWQVNNQWHVTDAREFDVAARPDPYNVYVASGLELVPDPNHGWPPVVGDKLIGRFTLGNNGGQGVQLERYGVRLFRNGTENLSFLNNGGSVYLSPGQTVRFDQNNEYQLSTGHYRAEITWQIGGQWHVTAGQEFDVLAAQTPGGLALAEPLSFTSEGSGQWPPRQGDKIIARIRVANVGDQSLHVPYIGVRGRRNGWETLDIGWFSVDIAGHSTWSLDANNEHALEQGDYAFRVSYSLDGQDWVELGNEVTFTVPGVAQPPAPTPTYTLSGRVTDSAGYGIPGVSVAAGGVSSITDEGGRFSLAGLPQGDWTVTPSRTGYTFDPPSQGFRVPAEGDGVRFVGTKPWTLMFFLAGDNDLEGAANYGYGAAIRGARNPDINVALFYDGYYSDARYVAAHHDGSKDVTWLEEPNTGDPSTLSDFVRWAKAAYPAHHYALVVFDHGHALGGIATDWRSGGVAWDTSSKNDKLTPTELKQALTEVGGLDVLYVFACLMGNLDIEYQLRGLADWYVAHESIGWSSAPHESYCLQTTGETTSEMLAISMAQAYYDSLHIGRAEKDVPPGTVSVVRLAEVEGVAQRASEFAQAIRSHWVTAGLSVWLLSDTSVLQRIDEADPKGIIGNEDRLVDLRHLALLVSGLGEPGLEEAGQRLIQALDAYVVYNRAWSNLEYKTENRTYRWDHSHAYGVSVHLPRHHTPFYKPEWLEFAGGANWSGVGESLAGDIGALQWGPMVVDLVTAFNPSGAQDTLPPEPIPPVELTYTAYVCVVVN